MTTTQVNYEGEQLQRGAEWSLESLKKCGVKTAIVKANAWADSQTPVGPFDVFYSDTVGCDSDCTRSYIDRHVSPVYLTIYV